MKKFVVLIFCLGFFSNPVISQLIPDPTVKPELQNKHWEASWVKVPGTAAYSYGVFFYRNELVVAEIPGSFIIHVSADNRYKLYVNGSLIGLGPSRSDENNWKYETYDIAKYLKNGKNTLAAEVWNFGEYKPWAQISLFSGFIVQGDNEQSALLNTPGNWKCMHAECIQPIEIDGSSLGTFIIVGPGDHIDGTRYPWGWKNSDYSMDEWVEPDAMAPGSPKGVGTDITHALITRKIPAMEVSRINDPVLRKSDDKILQGEERSNIENRLIPANTKQVLLLDQTELVTAYPELMVSGGANTTITLRYAESLYNDQGLKLNRDSVAGLNFRGNSDQIICDGESERIYSTLWFRTFRYIQLEIDTKDEPLTLHSLSPLFTAYPFREIGWFRSNEEFIDPLWKTGWQTSRLCANELYYDCPYYEQMQYVGDTRIQALISLYVSGDDRLMKKAIDDYFNSIIPEGLTMSRYPTEPRQVIPTYSLFWITMLHDYIWHRNDYLFVSRYLTSMQHVLQWFENRIDESTGLLGGIEYWPFVDWTDQWPWDADKRIGGVPPGGQEGQSSIITLQFAMTLQQAAEILRIYGLEKLAGDYEILALQLTEAVKIHCWDENYGLIADTPEKKSFSQHANTFAVLTGLIPKTDQPLFMEKILRDTTLIQSSLYFRYYVNRAAIEAGLGHKYLKMLDPWREMMKAGLTTFAEIPDTKRTRSDCHAWSASPLYELLATVAGIKPAAPGFSSVIIEPHPGGLEWIEAGVPHQKGIISVDLRFSDDGSVKGKVKVPQGLTGVFVWDHQTIDLVPGEQKIRLKPISSKFSVR